MKNYFKMNFNKSSISSFINHNEKNFENLKKNSKGKVSILVEFHGWSFAHICYGYLLSALKKKYPGKIYAYEGYRLISNNLEFSFKDKLKWILGQKFNIKNFGIYKSLGISRFISPEIDKNISFKTMKLTKNLKFKTKNEVINFKIKNIKIGDLIYDTYLKKKRLPTIDLTNHEFKSFFIDCIKVFFYWENFFKNNNVKAIIVSHSVYLYGMIMRIALNYNVKAFKPNFHTIYQIKEKNYSIGREFFEFKKICKKLKFKEKKSALKKVKYQMNLMLQGKKKFGLGYSYKKNKITKIKTNKKIKVLIALHNFYDSPHVFGNMLFPDFYEWLRRIVELSKRTDYEWLVKLHPENTGKDIEIIKDILKDNLKIKIISNKTNQNEIIKYGINFVLTCFGSIGYEYAYRNVTVINACIKNPHAGYNFTLNPKSIKEFDKIILNLQKYKLKPNKKEILEFLYIRRFYSSINWMNIEKKTMFNISNGFGWKKIIHRPEMYTIWINEFDDYKHSKILKTCQKFVNSNDFKLNSSYLLNKNK